MNREIPEKLKEIYSKLEEKIPEMASSRTRKLLPLLLKARDFDLLKLEEVLESLPTDKIIFEKDLCNLIKQSIDEYSSNPRQENNIKKKTRRSIDLLYEEFKLRWKGKENKIKKELENTGVFEAFDLLLEIAYIQPTPDEYNRFEIDLNKSQLNDFIKASESWFLKNRPKFLRIPPLKRFNLQSCLLLLLTIYRDYSFLSSYNYTDTQDKLKHLEKQIVHFLEAFEKNKTLTDLKQSKESFLDEIKTISEFVKNFKNVANLNSFCSEVLKFYSLQEECFLSADSCLFSRNSLPCMKIDSNDLQFHKDNLLIKKKKTSSNTRARTLPPCRRTDNSQCLGELQCRIKLNQTLHKILQADQEGNSGTIFLLQKVALELKEQILKFWNKQVSKLSTDFSAEEVKNDILYLKYIDKLEEKKRTDCSAEVVNEIEKCKFKLLNAWNAQPQKILTFQTMNFYSTNCFSPPDKLLNENEEKIPFLGETFGPPLDFHERIQSYTQENLGKASKRNDSLMTFAPKSNEQSFDNTFYKRNEDTHNQASRDNCFNTPHEYHPKTPQLKYQNSLFLLQNHNIKTNSNRSESCKDNNFFRENKLSEEFVDTSKKCSTIKKQSFDREKDSFLRSNFNMKLGHSNDRISLQNKIGNSNSNTFQQSQITHYRTNAVRPKIRFQKGIGFMSKCQANLNSQGGYQKPSNTATDQLMDTEMHKIDMLREEKTYSLDKNEKYSIRHKRMSQRPQRSFQKLANSKSSSINPLSTTKNQDGGNSDLHKEMNSKESKLFCERRRTKASSKMENLHNLGSQSSHENKQSSIRKTYSMNRIGYSKHSELMRNQIEEKVKEALEIYQHLINENANNKEEIKQAENLLSSLSEVVKSEPRESMNRDETIKRIFHYYSAEKDFIDLAHFLQFCKDVKLVKVKFAKQAKRFSDKQIMKIFDAFSNSKGKVDLEMFRKIILKMSESYYDNEFDMIHCKNYCKLSSSQKLAKFCEKLKRDLSNLGKI